MKNNPKFYLLIAMIATSALLSCGKNKCHECHYDGLNGIVELGEQCGDDIEALEANGYTDSTGTYEVHCHEH
jgi:hypothetical protein